MFWRLQSTERTSDDYSLRYVSRQKGKGGGNFVIDGGRGSIDLSHREQVKQADVCDKLQKALGETRDDVS